MAKQYLVTLKDLIFSCVVDQEIRTVLHTSEFSGHEKHYKFTVFTTNFEIIWRNGVDNIYIDVKGGKTRLETSERVDYIKVCSNEHLIEFAIPDTLLKKFCSSLEALYFNEPVWMDIPQDLEKLLHLYPRIIGN